MSRPILCASFCAALLFCIRALAADASSVTATNPPMKSVGPGLFEIGKVRLNKNERTVSFPGVVNLSPGLIEYVAVTEAGKIHESLFRTDAEPYQIHVAMLLLGAKGAGTNSFPEKPGQPLPGDKVIVEVSWKSSNGVIEYRRAEEMVFNQQTKSTMSRGHGFTMALGSRTAFSSLKRLVRLFH